AELGIADAQVVLVDHKVKETLRVNTQQAIAAGVFGVPTFLCDGELFWGDDSTSLFLAFLKDREMFRRDPYLRLGQISASAERVAGVAKTTA
ncbi:MAG TPA: DsbA family protein, partial [Rhizobiaceae bacterium]|nr:DsbA family protein [Rhizobiaceae bacterium]